MHVNYGKRYADVIDHRSCIRNVSCCEIKALTSQLLN